MTAFVSFFKMNLKRRVCDGFAVGYNILFPLVMIGILGALCRNMRFGMISGFAYYAVVMIPFCILMSVVTAAYAGKDDAYAKTAERVLLTPLSVKSIVVIKVLTCSLVIFACSMLVYGICCIAIGFSVKSLIPVALLFGTITFATSAVGTLIGLGTDNFLLIKNIMNLPIAVFAIMGGTFFRIGAIGRVGRTLLNLSPLRWINQCLFQLLYDHNSYLLWCISGISFVIGCLCILLAAVTFKKEEYLHGDIPGYEK